MDVFLHIPKTGGTSLRSTLRWLYGWQGVHTTPTHERNPAVTAEKVRGKHHIRLVRGHVAFGIHEYISESCRYFTMLRDPVSRVLSLYYNVKYWSPLPEATLSLEKWLDATYSSYVQNDQTKRIAGVEDEAELPEGDLLKRAKRNLEQKITVCGLTEHFDESMLLFRRRLGWKRYPFYLRGKTNRKRPRRSSIDRNIVAKIRRQNTLDLALYRYAQDRFEEMVDGQNGFEDDLRRFRKLNNTIQIFSTPLLKGYRYGRKLFS